MANSSGRFLLISDPQDRARWDPDGARPLQAAVRKQISRGWWPLDRQSTGPGVEPGDEALAVVREKSVDRAIARVRFGRGPSRELGGDARRLPIAATEVFPDPVQLPADDGQRHAGLTPVPHELFDGLLAADRGSRPWVLDPWFSNVEFVTYREVRRVRVDPTLLLESETDSPWPTVDGSGRLRFDPLAVPEVRYREIPQELREKTEGVGDLLFGLFRDEPEERATTVLAVAADGWLMDISDEALVAAWTAHAAWEGGVAEERDGPDDELQAARSPQ